ncbi:MAG: NAD-dependent succinate-semialdehyde dehydrogenase [Marinilabiliaceae bacterium]|nr:NAD-dependent succinate-semialdehyde dehydrogenase [Marinilabiliaceae bacterium]
MLLRSINPATGELIGEYPETPFEEIEQRVQWSNDAFQTWKKTPIRERVALFTQLANALNKHNEPLAQLITLEMGKTIREARAEISKCEHLCRYYASNGEEFIAPKRIITEASQSYVCYRPLGPILAIMPWNFPFWQVFRCAIPALTSGNTILLKHAANVSGCSIAIERLFKDSGFPEHVFQSLLITGQKVEVLINHRKIKGISLTGSTEVGRTVAQQAGRHLKKTVMELGGSDPYIILADADIDNAVQKSISGRLLNAGQSCIGAKRFIIVENIYDSFVDRFVHSMRTAHMGNPLDENTQIGPMARMNLRDDLHMQVIKSLDKGATLLTGGILPETSGYFYPPTVLADLRPGMPAWHEELFGPVASIIKVKDHHEAVAIANDTSFGLGSAIFTNNITLAQKLAEEELDAGCCFVNDMVRSDPRLPFGGINDSGYGRELSREGVLEFCNVKTIWIK